MGFFGSCEWSKTLEGTSKEAGLIIGFLKTAPLLIKGGEMTDSVPAPLVKNNTKFVKGTDQLIPVFNQLLCPFLQVWQLSAFVKEVGDKGTWSSN